MLFACLQTKNFNSEYKKKRVVLNVVLFYTPWKALCWAGKISDSGVQLRLTLQVQIQLLKDSSFSSHHSLTTALQKPSCCYGTVRQICISKAYESLAGSLNNRLLKIVHTFQKHLYLRCSSNETKPYLALKKIHWWHWIHNGIRLDFIAHRVKSIRYGFWHVR